MVDKITQPASQLDLIEKVNEIIDDTITVDQTYNASSTNAQSGTAVADAISGKQDELVSGVNIKTINNINILGSGNIDVSGGGSTVTPTWGNIAGTLSDQTDLKNALDSKQDELVSGTNIKTINGTSVLGSGNISTTAAVDGVSVDYNTANELETIAVIDNRDGTPRPVWTGTKAQYNALQSIDDDMLYNVTDDDDSSYINIVRSLGQIVTSTIPLVDSGLHLLDGGLLYEAGAYKEFVDYMIELYGDGTNVPNYFCTEQEWQTAVTTYGICGKFVYDSVNNTLRLPKYGSQIVTDGSSPSTAPVVGNGKSIALTSNGSNSLSLYFRSGYDNTAHVNTYNANLNTAISTNNGTNTVSAYSLGVSTDSTKSGLVADLANLELNTVEGYYYVVVATVVKTDIEVDIDEIATDLNGKADVDLVNVNNVGTSLGASWAMRSDTSTPLTLTTDSTQYTAPANGWFFINAQASASQSMVGFDGFCYNWITNASGNYVCATIAVRKGQKVKARIINVSNINCRFYYAVGSESEAS